MTTPSQDLSNLIVQRQWDRLAQYPGDSSATARLDSEIKRRIALDRLLAPISYADAGKQVVINEDGTLGKEEPSQPEAIHFGIDGKMLDRIAKQADHDASDSQREAGNYRKAHVTIRGLDITIETAKGKRRRPEWPPLENHYGYIKRTNGADGEHVDAFLGPDPHSEVVFVVDQLKADRTFDEHKVMLGFTSEDEARRAYLANYSPGWRGFGGMKAMTIDAFKEWLTSGDTANAAAPQRILFAIDDNSVLHYAKKHKNAPGQGFFEWGEEQERQHPRVPKGREGGGRFTAAQASEAASVASTKAHESGESHHHQQAKHAHHTAADAHREEGNHQTAMEHMREASRHADHAERDESEDDEEQTKPKNQGKEPSLPIGKDGVLANHPHLPDEWHKTLAKTRVAAGILHAQKPLGGDGSESHEELVAKVNERIGRDHPQYAHGHGHGKPEQAHTGAPEPSKPQTSAMPPGGNRFGGGTIGVPLDEERQKIIRATPDKPGSGDGVMKALGAEAGQKYLQRRANGENHVDAVIKAMGWDRDEHAQQPPTAGKVSISKTGSLAAPQPAQPVKLTKEEDAAVRAICKLPDATMARMVQEHGVTEKSKWGQAVALVKAGAKPPAPAVAIDKSGAMEKPADYVEPIRIMGEDMTLAETKEIDGVAFDRFETKSGGAIRMTDKDSGNVISIKKYPSLESVRSGYANETAKALKMSGGGADGAVAAPSPRVALANTFAAKLSNGETITAKSLLQAADEAHGGTRAEGKHDPSDVYDSLEAGFNKSLVGRTDPKLGLDGAIKQAEVIAERVNELPTQTNRSGNKDAFQQFSTPPHYAYAVAWLANLNSEDLVLEPTAGTGCLAVQAGNAGATVHANELDPARAEHLRELFGSERVTQENAEQIGAILPNKGIVPTAVVMNPPFSQTAGRLGDKKDLMAGANHISEALQTLAPGGRLVAIVGGGVSRDGERKAGMSPESPTYRQWFADLAKKGYDLRANVGVSGDEYKKYGTHFGTRVLIIDKTGGTDERTIVTGDVETIPDLMRMLEGVRNDRPLAHRQSSGKPPGTENASGVGSDADDSNAPDAAGVRVSGKPAQRSGGSDGSVAPGGGKADAEASGGSGGAAGGGLRTTAKGSDAGGAASGVASPEGTSGHAPARDGGARKSAGQGKRAGGESASQPGASVSGLRPAEPVRLAAPGKAASKKDNSSHEDIGPSLFEAYQPYAKVEGAQPHPSALVESAAMSGVKPPKPTYQPSLSPDLVEKGMLSGAQLESVVYAGQAHQQMLPAAEGEEQYRRGFFVGDGTGVGKGREVAAIITDNLNQGRKKHVWVSQKQNLLEDAKRDWKGLGRNPNELIHFDNIRKGALAGKPIGDGVGFVTYDTLKGKPKDPTKASNLDHLVDWLGKDFDGVIAFDEAHGMGNAINTEGGRGTKKASARALAGVELQKRLPKARVVYVSATGATELSNLAYAERLGIWGRETPFPTKQHFIEKMSEGGVAAMEAVAQSLKATGGYLARSLSFDDGTPNGKVTYERLTHQLSSDQLQTYDGLADGWQTVLQNIDKALEASGGADSAQAKNAAKSQFWGAQQRFFNQVMTSMQTPSVINAMEKDIAEGRAPVVQLVNTMEAATKRALARQATGDEDEDQDLEDLDVSPREVLMQYLENSFPIHRWEEYQDNDGNTQHRLVKDANGDPVVDPEAARMRDEMLDMVGTLKIPESPLDMVINHFGHENVAECTGRTQRVIVKEQEDGTKKKVIDRRNIVNSNAAEAHDFQSGKKKILVFSDAGGTGRSYHADKNAVNQDQRVHYMLQPGWRADNAVQGLGRTHRTNQAIAPTYRLVEIANLKAQKRFISTIARRLDQLGALTRGQRQAGGGGLFSAADNLESPEARTALDRFFMDLKAGSVEGLSHSEVMSQLGFKVKDDEEGGKKKKADDPPPMSQFLNRLLSLRVEMQAKVFDAFDQRLQEAVERAIESGTMDTGVEKFPAESLAKKKDQVVYTDPNSGAEVRHFVVTATTKTKKRAWDANERGEKPLHFVKDGEGQVWAAYKATDETDARSGRIMTRFRLRGPGSDKYRPAHEVDSPYPEYAPFQKIEKEAAKALWEKQHAEIPDTETSDENFVTGAMLPIWDRIPGSQPKIFRLKTTDGETVVGRHVPKKAVPILMKNLGVGHEADRHEPSDIHAKLSAGRIKSATLATGWKIKTAMVSGERRIELKGDKGQGIPHAVMDELEDDGVIRERIQYETRFFVPTGAAGVKVLERITKARPIVDVE